MSMRFFTDGVCREFWDDQTRTYTAYNADGSPVPSTQQNPNPRPYTPQENTRADDEAAAQVVLTELETRRAAVRAIITELVAEKDRCNTVIAKDNSAITGGDTKDVARAAKRIADAAIDLAKLLDGRI